MAKGNKIVTSEELTREKVESLRNQMKADRAPWEPVWRDIGDFMSPNRLRFHATDNNRPAKSRLNGKVINPAAIRALNILKSGMHSGITSPARPWFRLTTPDPDMAEFGPVSEWLHQVTQRMMTVFHRSNLYRALPTIYGDCGGFGTASAIVLEDEKDVIRITTDPVGSYSVATDDRGIVDARMREIRMTIRQVVQRYGLDNCSIDVQQAYKSGSYEKEITIVHCVFPNPNHDPRNPMPRFMKYASVHYEEGRTERDFLRYSGFNENALLAPRWDVTGEDVYGKGLGMEAIGSSKALQLMERRKQQAIDKKVNPPMIGDSSLQNHRASTLPGDITYVSSALGVQGFRPAYEVNFDIRELIEDIQRKEDEINSTFYADLFLMLAMSDRRQMTATEVAERHDEKLLMLGPVLERLNDELLNPLIDRTFSIMERQGLIPQPPPELEGVDLKVEHISILAQAQKMVSTSAVDRFLGFVGNLAQMDQGVLDNVDFDAATQEYGEMMGVSPNLIRPIEQVDALRQQRAEALAAQQQQEQAMAATQAAKNLGQANTNEGTALADVMEGMGAG